MSTSAAVHRLENTSNANGRGIDEVLRVQQIHGDRISLIENKHDALDARVTLALHTERIAQLLETKTEEVAKRLASKTDKIAQELAEHKEKTTRKSK